jgi:hypothetical protein
MVRRFETDEAGVDHVVGVHFTDLFTPPPAADELSLPRRPGPPRQDQTASVAPAKALRATRPQTISYALTDSPAGLHAWIAEKLTAWVDPRSTITLDQIPADFSIYWFTATAGASGRLANESRRGMVPCPVPVGVVVLPYDILQSVRPLAEQDYDIAYWTEFDRGGHFSGLEVLTSSSAPPRRTHCRRRGQLPELFVAIGKWPEVRLNARPRPLLNGIRH